MEVQAPHPLQGIAMDSVVGVLASAEDHVGAESSSPLAIHVYSKLAKLHKHSLIPYLPRIMASVLSSLSCSLQLHPACAQVVAALAAHTIDSSCDPAFNEDTLRNLCHPLLSALSISHPPHLAAGVASCLQTIVESNRWRCAPLDLQELVCMKGTDALMDEGTQTVAHMDLMGSLAKLSSNVVIQGYGAPLLRAGMGILHSSCDTAKRVAAAQLLQSVLKIVDADLLDLDLSPIVGVLQECQQDRIAGVRSAAADALRTASMYVTCDIASQKTQGPPSHQSLQQSSRGSRTMCLMNFPAIEHELLPVVALPNGGTPCHGTAFTSTPCSNVSNKWLKRLPLAPLQQSSLGNPPLVAASHRRPATFKQSEYKENIAPTHKTRSRVASQDKSRKTWVSKRESPMLWPKDAMRKDHSESLSLFDSPQTPIVPYSEGAEAKDGNSSVTFLLEKHFGKQRDRFEDQFQVSLSKSNTDMTRSARDEIFNHRKELCGEDEICNSFGHETGMEDQSGEGEVCTSFDSETVGRRSIDSPRTNTHCGSERLYSPSQESVGECESGASSEQDSGFQVTKNLVTDEDLLMTPKRLICSMQSDDEDRSSLDQEDFVDSDAGSHMYGSDELDEDDYDVDLDTDAVSEESIASSPCTLPENYNLHCEWDAQVSISKQESGTRKRAVKCDKFSDMQEAGRSAMSTLKYPREASQGEDSTMQCHAQVLHGHGFASCEGDRVKGALSPIDFAGSQINVELRTVKPTQTMERMVRSRLWRKAQVLLLVVIAVGLFCAGIMTYMGSMEASNMLVPT